MKQEPITKKQDWYITKNKTSLMKMGIDIENIQFKNQAIEIIKEHKKLK